MFVHPATSTQARNVLGIDGATYDQREIPKCAKLILDVITEEEERSIIRVINPRYPGDPEENKSIPVSPDLIQLKKRMSSQFEAFLYDVSGIQKQKPHYILINVTTLAPDDKINWKSDGFIMTLNMGSDAIVLFRKKGTSKVYKVFFPRRSMMMIKDPFLDYERKFDDSPSLRYQPSPLFPSTSVKREYRYLCIWALSHTEPKYKYKLPETPEDYMFEPEELTFDVDGNQQVFISSDEVKRYKEHFSADKLVAKLMDTPIYFPYHKYYMSYSSKDMFENLKSFPYRIRSDNQPYKEILNVNNKNKDMFFYQSSIRPPYCTIVNVQEDYDKIDSITDYFSEEARMQTIVNSGGSGGVRISPYEWWYSDWRKELFQHLLSTGQEISTESLHENMHHMIKEATLFKVSMSYSVIRVLGEYLGCSPDKPTGLRYLDMSSGWGDRLISALAAGCSRYLGYDPNQKLQSAYRQILSELGKHSGIEKSVLDSFFEVRCEPFEKAKLPKEEFDICFTSPPYFKYEIYSKESTQSVSSYPEYNQWLNKFLFVSLRKIWYVLREGGLLAIHIQDLPVMPNICSLVNLFIQAKLTNAEYMGVISSQYREDEEDDQSGKPRRPIWIWKKGSEPAKSTLSKTKNERPLMYQEAEFRLKKYYSNYFIL